MTSEVKFQIPTLEEVQVRNHPMPLYHAHWRGLVETAYAIRQEVAAPLEDEGLDFLLTQYENTQRGVETLRGQVLSKYFLKEQKAGVEAWLSRLCYLINQKTKGYKPLEKLQLVLLTRQNTNFFAYYGKFYSDQMEIIIYIGSREDIDGALVFHRQRSNVDLKSRDWSVLAEYLPEVVWAKI